MRCPKRLAYFTREILPALIGLGLLVVVAVYFKAGDFPPLLVGLVAAVTP